MPKFPEFARRVSEIEGAAFEKYRVKMEQFGQGLIRLHLGDTYLLPSYTLPLRAKLGALYSNYNRYCDTFGIDPLRTELVKKLGADNNFNINSNNILITAGASNALSAAVLSVLNPDDEILVLTPYWPLFRGMVYTVGAAVREVPLYMKLYENQSLDLEKYLDTYLTSRTVAIYLNSPNNPSGKVLSIEHLNQIASFTRKNSLWMISDEAYDGLTFDDFRHISIATLKDMFSQTISVFTFSKIFMFAGLRLGYAVAREEVISNLNKIMVHQIYSPSTLAQQMMIEPIRTRHNWMSGIREQYQDLRNLVDQVLDIKHHKPEAGYFFFISVQDYLNNQSFESIIDTCFASGVSVAPGIEFGSAYKNYIRLCFTGESRQRLKKGIERLNKIFKKIS